MLQSSPPPNAGLITLPFFNNSPSCSEEPGYTSANTDNCVVTKYESKEYRDGYERSSNDRAFYTLATMHDMHKQPASMAGVHIGANVVRLTFVSEGHITHSCGDDDDDDDGASITNLLSPRVATSNATYVGSELPFT